MFNLFGRMKFGCFRRPRVYNKLIYTLVNFETAKKMIENHEIVLIDVRSKKEYDFMHIKEAINITSEEIQGGKIDFPKDSKIMVYCSSGTRSKTAISSLNRLGYTNIYIWEYASVTTFPYKNLIIYNKN